jgi:hypothetical protein
MAAGISPAVNRDALALHFRQKCFSGKRAKRGTIVADIAAVLGRLTAAELEEIHATGPQGHLSRRIVEALDRAAGGPGGGRGYYVPAGSVSGTGSPHVVLRSDVAAWLFGHAAPAAVADPA